MEEMGFEFFEVYPMASRKAKKMADIGVKFGLAVEPGADINKPSVEARLLLGYLKMCPISGTVDEIDTAAGRVLVADLYYDAAPILSMFCE